MSLRYEPTSEPLHVLADPESMTQEEEAAYEEEQKQREEAVCPAASSASTCILGVTFSVVS